MGERSSLIPQETIHAQFSPFASSFSTHFDRRDHLLSKPHKKYQSCQKLHRSDIIQNAFRKHLCCRNCCVNTSLTALESLLQFRDHKSNREGYIIMRLGHELYLIAAHGVDFDLKNRFHPAKRSRLYVTP